MNKYRNVVFVLIFFGMVSLLIGVTYSFFNYTRTGSANTVSVGNISFTSTEGPAINLSNVFPIDRNDIDTDADNVGSVTINVTGSTNYTEGVEYLITAVDLNNKIPMFTTAYKSVPIGIDVTYSNNGTGTTIGIENDSYFDEGERGGNTSYYKVLSYNTVMENDKLVVGYIAPGETGINGNITIKTFLDKEYVAISDTAPAGNRYVINPNMNQQELDICTSFLGMSETTDFLSPGDTLEDFCNGTGTITNGEISFNFQEFYDLELKYVEGVSEYLERFNVIQYSDVDGTTDEWVANRIILTTSEWNSLTTNGISFKIKVEANEGIWVEEPGKIEGCPDCKFFFRDNTVMYMASNDYNESPTVVTTGLYDSYLDIVENLGKKHFLGLVLNNSNQITKAYACGVKDNIPFCVEGTSDSADYVNKQNYLQSVNLWNGTCNVGTQFAGTPDEYGETYCTSNDYNGILVEIHDHGCAVVAERHNESKRDCRVTSAGYIACGEYSG